MTRKQALAYIRIAGYHGDRAELTRLYVENRVALPAALEAFDLGAAMKKNGVPCPCPDCRDEQKLTRDIAFHDHTAKHAFENGDRETWARHHNEANRLETELLKKSKPRGKQ